MPLRTYYYQFWSCPKCGRSVVKGERVERRWLCLRCAREPLQVPLLAEESPAKRLKLDGHAADAAAGAQQLGTPRPWVEVKKFVPRSRWPCKRVFRCISIYIC